MTVDDESRPTEPMPDQGIDQQLPLVELLRESQPNRNRYTSCESLGRGGMGDVALCTDNLIGRDVAMKTIRPDHRDRLDHLQRFLREALVQARLEHPAVVPVYDIGMRADGDPFFTMKRIRGVTLKQILGELHDRTEEVLRRYGRNTLLGVFRQICLAVDFAHAHGVIHRDLKPGNVMLGDFGEVYVLDWGSVKLDPAALSAPTAQTLEGQVIGTLRFMSPEQARGEPIDARTDVYSLGVILAEVCKAAGAREAMTPELDAIIARALAPDRRARYPSARALADAVERFLDGDRDLEMRRTLAEQHGREAEAIVEQILARATATEPNERSIAMRSLGRALAFDPENARARGALMKLLLAPPRITPPEVEDALIAIQRERESRAAKSMTPALVMFGIMIALVVWMGIADPRWFAVTIAAFSLLLVAHLIAGPRAGKSDWPRALAFGGLMVFGLSLSGIAGPLVLVPGFLTAAVTPFIVATNAKLRYWWPAIAALAMTALVGLTESGVVRDPFFLDGDLLCIRPQMAHFARVPTVFALLLAAITTIVTPGIVIGMLRAQLDRAERELLIQKWHLERAISANQIGRDIIR